MERLLGIALIATLAACGPSEEQRANVERALPGGCELVDLGAYGEIERLVFVQCEGGITRTTISGDKRAAGKSVRTYSSVMAELPPP